MKPARPAPVVDADYLAWIGEHVHANQLAALRREVADRPAPDPLQRLLHCAAEIRENVAMRAAWSTDCDTATAPHRSSLGEMDWREEMAALVAMARMELSLRKTKNFAT